MQAFHGTDLRKIIRANKAETDLLNFIDPDGMNLVRMSMPHNDGDELRVLFMAKYLGSDRPHEAVVHMTFSQYNKFVQHIAEDDEVH